MPSERISTIPGGPFKSWQLAAFFIPFLLPLPLAVSKLGPLPPTHPFWTVLLFALGVLWVLVFGAGLVKGLPAWSLPSAGIVLLMVSFFFKWMVQALVMIAAGFPTQITLPDDNNMRILILLLTDLIFVVPMLLFLAFLLLAAPPLQRRVRENPSVLSLLIYGMAIPPLVQYDEYQGRAIYELGAVFSLIAGAALFLILRSKWARVLVLALAVLLSAIIMTYGLYSIFPDQYFATEVESFRIWESIQPLLQIPALLILLLLMPILPRLPLFKGTFQVGS
jgi:hypothetical protein